MEDITGNEVKMASMLIKDLLKTNDPLIEEMIAWYCKDYYLNEAMVRQGLQSSPDKREGFYRNFMDNCKDPDLREKFSGRLDKY